ncbi:hypothetical protein MYX82_06125 [Acidobacteria bacterium AH-259-D05]|nr:hypothetical protein [Acidobacteria bacterium AH-259-D05]
MSNFPNSQDEISETQPGDSSPKKIIKKQDSQEGKLLQEKILFPKANPRKYQEENSHFKAVQHIHDKQNLADHNPGAEGKGGEIIRVITHRSEELALRRADR